MFDTVFETINRNTLVKGLIKRGYKRDTINKAIHKEKFSSSMAPDVEDLTAIPAIFWMRPDLYGTNGEKK